MDPLTAIGLVANVLQFLDFFVKILLMLIYQLRHRTKLSNKENVIEAADPLSTTKRLEVPECHELALWEKYLPTIQYPINERLVFFVDAVRRRHLVPLHQCGTTEVLRDFIVIISPVVNVNQYTRVSSPFSF